MKTIEQQIDEVVEQIRPLEKKLEKLRYEKRHKDSRDFISANRITLEAVEMSDGPGKPRFGHIADFVEWLKTNSTKRWAEWNMTIYFQSDLKAGRMPEMPAVIYDLKKEVN